MPPTPRVILSMNVVQASSWYNNPLYWNYSLSGSLCNCHWLPYLPYLHRQAQSNSVDLDKTPEYAAADQGLHCLPLIQKFSKHPQVIKLTCSYLRHKYGKELSFLNIKGKYGTPILLFSDVFLLLSLWTSWSWNSRRTFVIYIVKLPAVLVKMYQLWSSWWWLCVSVQWRSVYC